MSFQCRLREITTISNISVLLWSIDSCHKICSKGILCAWSGFRTYVSEIQFKSHYLQFSVKLECLPCSPEVKDIVNSSCHSVCSSTLHHSHNPV